MLRSYDQVQATVPRSRLIASGDGCAVVTGGGQYETRWHWHDCMMILLPLRGPIRFSDEGRKAGTWLTDDRFAVVPGSQAHATTAGQGHKHAAIYVTNAAVDQRQRSLGASDRFRKKAERASIFPANFEIQTLQHLCFAQSLGNHCDAVAREHLTMALLLRLFAQVDRVEPLSGSRTDEYGELLVQRIRFFIEERISDQLTLDQIADSFDLSRRHLTRLFRRWAGTSISDYQEMHRIKVAQELLANTTLPVGEIAWRVGLESGSALAKTMRKVLGECPSEFRARSLDR